MLWHIVRFRFPDGVDPAARESLETALAGLDAIDVVRIVRVARDLDDPQVTGLLTGFTDADALAVYRDHPEHVPVLQRARELCESITRLDMVTADPPDALSRRDPGSRPG